MNKSEKLVKFLTLYLLRNSAYFAKEVIKVGVVNFATFFFKNGNRTDGVICRILERALYGKFSTAIKNLFIGEIDVVVSDETVFKYELPNASLWDAKISDFTYTNIHDDLYSYFAISKNGAITSFF